MVGQAECGRYATLNWGNILRTVLLTGTYDARTGRSHLGLREGIISAESFYAGDVR